jgi:hypothetical protein
MAVRQLVVPPFITNSSTQRWKRLCREAGLTFKAYATCSMAELTPPLLITVPVLIFTPTVATSIYTGHFITLTEVTICPH